MEQNQPPQPSANTKSGLQNSVYLPVLFAFLIVFGMLIGIIISYATVGKGAAMVGNRSDKFSDIINFIKYRYVDTINTDQFTENSIQRILSGLDPHSAYIPAKDLENVNESLEGNFEGIGVEFYIVQDTINVVSAISGGPAEMVGVRAGDKIVKIEDTVVAGVKIKNEQVTKKLRGKGGTKVTIYVKRNGEKNLKPFTITRGQIPLYSIDAAYMIDNETGYIKVNRFSESTHTEFRQKLRELNHQGMKNLVVDLRQNPGGYLQAATEMLDEIISGEKLLVYTNGNAVGKQEYFAKRPGEFERGKVAILIDQGSASASEIMAGAVQDWDRGTIIGRTSFGKGLVQEQYDLSDGSALRLTVARYYTPSGRCIQKPYDKGTDAYYGEVYERYEKGEMVHEDTTKKLDSTLIFKTSKGRTVYANGGIKPDIFVPIDTAQDIDYLYAIRMAIPEFTYKKFGNNPSMLDAYSDYKVFNNRYQVDPAFERELLESVPKENGFKIDEKRYAKVSAKVRQYIKAYLAKQKWKNDGFYYIVNDKDEMIAKSLSSFAK